ncbi:MAG: O-antigen ligase family protein, partial [Phycisphaerales bacterium]|nr:O-antigen ligase family protein [Phycisphaerales bacterium]
QSLRIDKIAACHIGAILGTLLFAPHVLRRFRFQWVDLMFGIVLTGAFATSILNNLGSKEGLSLVVNAIRGYLPLLVLARIYITSFASLLQAMRFIVGGALIYAMICVLEWRLSPQLHTWIYGYFQHSFDEFMRYNRFRPAGFVRHAIELSSFMAMAAVLTGWLAWKKMFRPLWGFVPAGAVLTTILIGLAVTMTVSGYAEFLLSAFVLTGLLIFRTRWVLWILPLIAIVWIAGRGTGMFDAVWLVDMTKRFNPERAASVQYRLESEQLNLDLASRHWLFGQGARHGAVRKSDGEFVLALDAQWLINLVFFGIVGLAGWFMLWAWAIVETTRRWRRISPQGQALAAVVCVLVGAQFIDFLFNDFPSWLLLILNIGLISAMQHERSVPRRNLRQSQRLTEVTS